MGDYISISFKNFETFIEEFYVFNLDGQNYMQYGLKGMYSKIAIKNYEQLVGMVMGYTGLIGLDGLPLS
jgi:hypothetical protein